MIRQKNSVYKVKILSEQIKSNYKSTKKLEHKHFNNNIKSQVNINVTISKIKW